MKKFLLAVFVVCFSGIVQAADQVTCDLWYVKTGQPQMINPIRTHLPVDLSSCHRSGKNISDGTTLLTLVFEKGTFYTTHLNLPTGQKNKKSLKLEKGITYTFHYNLIPQRVDGHDVDATFISCALD